MEQKSIFTVLALIAALGIAAASHAQSAATQKTMLQMKALGTSALTMPAPGAVVNDDNLIRQDHDSNLMNSMVSASQTAAPQAALAVPSPEGTPFATANPGFSGFNGLTHLDQRLAGTGKYTNTQFSLEPPDQGLAVGNGFVLEAINTALAVYDTNGTLLAGPTALNQFFKLAPEVIRSQPPVFGDFTSDPKCLFDRQTQRWFITLLQIDVDPATGDFGNRSHLLVAVSQTSDPTLGFNLFSIDVTDDGTSGTPKHLKCPCFGDQPLIGTDRNGFFVSTNEFPIHTSGFNGAQVYAMSKNRLTQGMLSTVVHFSGLRFRRGPAFSVQPSTSPSFQDGDRGVEFLMSTLNFSFAVQNKIAVWAITNTESLSELNPDVDLLQKIVESEAYSIPPDAPQKAGPPGSRPLGEALGAPEELLSTGDHRMQQVVFAHGTLFSALTTAIGQGPNCVTGFESDCAAGIAWFQVQPDLDGDGKLKAKVVNQGYVAIDGNFAFYPSIGVNEHGQGFMSFSISGPDFFPSVGFVRIGENGTGKIHIADAGAGPDDGFTGYPVLFGNPNVQGSGRWGDYSAAVADAEGNIWFANESIPGGLRTLFANWGTFIGHARIDED
jgi:hypothetical protein